MIRKIIKKYINIIHDEIKEQR